MSFPAGSFPINATVVESQVSVTYENVSGGLTVENGITTDILTVNGNTILGDEASDVTTINGILNISGSVGVTGNTNFVGNLGVTGNTTLRGNLGVTGNTSLLGNLGVTGNTSLLGNLGVTGTTSLLGNLGVTGNTSLYGNLSVTGNTNLNGNLGVTGNTNLNGNLGVTGNTSLLGNLGVTGSSSLYGQFTASTSPTGPNNLRAHLDLNNDGSINLLRSDTAIGNTGVIISEIGNIDVNAPGGGYFQVNASENYFNMNNPVNTVLLQSEGRLTLSGGVGGVTGGTLITGGPNPLTIPTTGLLVTDTDLFFNGDLGLTGNTSLYGDLGVAGNVGVTGTTSLYGNLGVTGNINLKGNLGVTGSSSLYGTLNVTGASTLGGGVTGGLAVTGDLSVSSNVGVTGSLTVTGGTIMNGQTTIANKLVLSNQLSGTATLSSGGSNVMTSKALTGSLIFLQKTSGITGSVYVSSISNATSFTILSANGTDTSPVQWMIVNSS